MAQATQGAAKDHSAAAAAALRGRGAVTTVAQDTQEAAKDHPAAAAAAAALQQQ